MLLHKASLRVLFLGLFFSILKKNDVFYLTEMTQVCNTTFYVCDKDFNTLILEKDTAFEWIKNNFIKLNHKCHLLVSGYKHETVWAKICETKIWESNKQKLLGALIDGNLNFD